MKGRRGNSDDSGIVCVMYDDVDDLPAILSRVPSCCHPSGIDKRCHQSLPFIFKASTSLCILKV